MGLTIACTTISKTMYCDQLLLEYVAARVISKIEYVAPDSTTIFRAWDDELWKTKRLAAREVHQIRAAMMTETFIQKVVFTVWRITYLC